MHQPGLYVLDLDARLVDAIAAAGGTTEDADLAAINLARMLADGEQVVVPVIGDPEAVPGGGGAEPSDGLIDLNTADQAALDPFAQGGHGAGPPLAPGLRRGPYRAGADRSLAVNRPAPRWHAATRRTGRNTPRGAGRAR